MKTKNHYPLIFSLIILAVVLKFLFPTSNNIDVLFCLLGVIIFNLGYHFFVYHEELYNNSTLIRSYGHSYLGLDSPFRIKVFGAASMIAGVIAILGSILWLLFG